MSVRVRPAVAHLATTDVTHRHLLLPQLRTLRDEGWDVLAISAPGRWVGELEAEGIRHVPWRHVTRAWDPRADLRALAELVTILRRDPVSVLHCHNPKPGILGRVAGRVLGIPVILNTVHGLYAMPDDPLARRVPVLALEWLASRLGDLDLYQSNEDLAWSRSLGIARPGRAVWLGNGVDLSRFDPSRARDAGSRARIRRELGIPDDVPLVGTVGRMVREKGFREYFAAAAAVRAVRPDVRFVAVGEPDVDKADALTTVEIERASVDVLTTGWREDVPDLLSALDVFVLPSWREGLPRSAIEAAATGLPLVLSDIRGCREVADHGRCAVLVPPRDPAALAGAITGLLDDAALRCRLGSAAAERARDVFDERRVLSRIAFVSRALLPAQGTIEGVRLRRARPRDADRISALHRSGLPTAFLPRLGNGALRRFHASLIRDRGASVVVAVGEGEVIGFACATVSLRRSLARFVVRHGVASAIAMVPSLLRPGTARGLLESLRYAADGGPRLDGAELAAIVVDEAWRGRRVGHRLAGSVIDAMAARGAPAVKVLVEASNAPALGFYRSLGFRTSSRVSVHQEHRSLTLVRPCPAS